MLYICKKKKNKTNKTNKTTLHYSCIQYTCVNLQVIVNPSTFQERRRVEYEFASNQFNDMSMSINDSQMR